ncbi:hypothetical protein KSC_041780 [Ktedonobacter sp. SOSP1-52]|nr:hypothetical protein KSC_041780 [Ktedonobacter sp. SOSP1-52]
MKSVKSVRRHESVFSHFECSLSITIYMQFGGEYSGVTEGHGPDRETVARGLPGIAPRYVRETSNSTGFVSSWLAISPVS